MKHEANFEACDVKFDLRYCVLPMGHAGPHDDDLDEGYANYLRKYPPTQSQSSFDECPECGNHTVVLKGVPTCPCGFMQKPWVDQEQQLPRCKDCPDGLMCCRNEQSCPDCGCDDGHRMQCPRMPAQRLPVDVPEGWVPLSVREARRKAALINPDKTDKGREEAFGPSRAEIVEFVDHWLTQRARFGADEYDRGAFNATEQIAAFVHGRECKPRHQWSDDV